MTGIGTALATGIGGAAASKIFGGKKGNTTTAQAEPWRAAQPALERVLSEGGQLFDRGTMAPMSYQGPRVAGFSGQTQDALGALGQGSGLAQPSIANLTDIMGGEGMYRDFDRIRDNVGDRTKQELASIFAGGGINSSLAQDTYTRAMGDALANVEYGAYNDAQNRRLQALGMAPSISGMQGAEEKEALGAGILRDEKTQQFLDADRERFGEAEDRDYQALQRYAALAQGIGGMGGTSSQTSPQDFWGKTLPGIGSLASGIGGFAEGMNTGGGDFWGSLFGGGSVGGGGK